MLDGVLYVICGTKHWNHLLVSLVSLREHWKGPVCLAYGDEAGQTVADKIVSDERLGRVSAIDISEQYASRRNGAYLLKTGMIEYSPFDRTIFIDADTLVTGNISSVFPVDSEVVLTQFSEWVTTGNRMKKRIEHWKEVLPEQVELMTSVSFPAINTGVVGFSKRCVGFSKEWQEKTSQNVRFMCDELVAQLIYPQFSHRILDDRWNASIVYSSLNDARIIHGHGMKYHKTERGRELWMPWFKKVLEDNYAGIQDWWGLPRYPGQLFTDWKSNT